MRRDEISKKLTSLISRQLHISYGGSGGGGGEGVRNGGAARIFFVMKFLV